MKKTLINSVGLSGIALFALAVTLFASRLGSDVTIVLGATGIALIGIYSVFNFRNLIAVSRRRSARRGANAVLMIVFFTTILVVVQAISLRNRRDLDLTRDSRFTLAPQTIALLGSLDTDVSILAFFRRSSAARSSARDLIGRYVQKSARLDYEMIDPDEQPLVAHNIGARDESIVVRSGDRRRLLDTVSEESLTNAILQVTLDRYKAIYFVMGHGEKNPAARERTGYSRLKAGLEAEGYQVRDLFLVGVERIPADCEVLIIAGPQRPYLQTEVELVASYLRRGGSFMLLLDPRVDLPAIEALVGDYHVILDPAVILDAGEGEFDATVTRILRYEPHPITRGFNVITIFPMARPVRLDEAAMPPGMTGSYLAITEETAWGEVNMESFAVGSATREGEDIAPPLPVAATVLYTRVVPEQTEEQPERRLLVIGDSDFVSNEFYGVFGNSDFFINCINFLSEDEDRITIRPNRGPGDRFFITAGQGRFIFTTSIILLPLCVILVGTTVMFRKRRA